jgi:hypothetical protein
MQRDPTFQKIWRILAQKHPYLPVSQLNAKALERMFNRPLAKTAKKLGI